MTVKFSRWKTFKRMTGRYFKPNFIKRKKLPPNFLGEAFSPQLVGKDSNSSPQEAWGVEQAGISNLNSLNEKSFPQISWGKLLSGLDETRTRPQASWG